MTRLLLFTYAMTMVVGTKVSIATQTSGISTILWVWQQYQT